MSDGDFIELQRRRRNSHSNSDFNSFLREKTKTLLKPIRFYSQSFKDSFMKSFGSSFSSKKTDVFLKQFSHSSVQLCSHEDNYNNHNLLYDNIPAKEVKVVNNDSLTCKWL